MNYKILFAAALSVVIAVAQSGQNDNSYQDFEQFAYTGEIELDTDTESTVQTDEVKFFGDYIIDKGQVNKDKVRIVGGDLSVSGQIDGQFTVIGGDVYIKQGSIINGRIVAIGGTVHQEEGSTINGKVIETNISKGLSYKETFDESADVEGDSDFELKERSWYSKKSWIHPKTEWFIYNRNEGFLLTPFNYKWDRRSLSNLRLDLSAGWRFSQKTFAGRVTLETYLINRHLILFGSGFRESRTDDFYRLPQMENSLAGILGRQDFYDRWDETGFEGGVGMDLNWIRIKASYVAASIDSIPLDDGLWSLFNDSRSLRVNTPLTPSDNESVRLTFAFKPRSFSPYSTGIAIYAAAEQIMKSDVEEDFTRVLGMGVVGLEIVRGVVIRTRVLFGTSSKSLPEYRNFSVGGLGSISAYPYKLQTGDQFAQINSELIFTPEFLDNDWVLILFADGGNAWMKSDRDFSDTDSIFKFGKSSAGIGFGSSDDDGFNIRVNLARPLDGTDYLESTLRINYNF